MSPPDPAQLPRHERERRRRDMIVATRDVFAERAEFGKGMLYIYFPGGQDELLRTVLDWLYDDLQALIGPFRDAPLSDGGFGRMGASAPRSTATSGAASGSSTATVAGSA